MSDILFVEQSWWGWLIAGYLFLGGLAGVAVPVSFYIWYRYRSKRLSYGGGVVAFVAMIIGLLLLLLDLGRPQEVAALFFNPNINSSSWMTIGTYIIVIFTIVTALYIYPLIPWRMPLKAIFGENYIKTTGFIASIFGLTTAAYTGFLLSAAKGVQFWNTAILPILFLLSAASSGICGVYGGIVIPSYHFRNRNDSDSIGKIEIVLRRYELFLLLAELFVLFSYLNVSTWKGPGAVESVNRLITGDLSISFWIGVVLLGFLLPLALLLGYVLRKEKVPIMFSVVMGASVVIGTFIMRYVILEAGVIPVPLS